MPGSPSSAEVEIGPAAPDEIDAVRAMTRVLIDEIRPGGDLRPGFDEIYPPERIEEIIRDLPLLHAPPGGGIFVARGTDGLLGMAMLAPGPEGAGEVRRMYVAPGARGTGLASRLLAVVTEAAAQVPYPRLYLETGPHLKSAQAFYDAAGFARRGPPAGTSATQAGQAIFFEKPL